jgi:hypothetical protein
MPVWAFELAGVLLDVEGVNKLEGAAQNATQNAPQNAPQNAADTLNESTSAAISATQPFVRVAP